MDDLKTKTLRGLLWSYLDAFGIYFIKFGFTIAIARALSPRDYGLMGMIVIFTALANMLSESGFAMALIQKKKISPDDLSTVFWFNISIATTLYIVLYFSAEAIAHFYEEPLLIDITRVAGLSMVLSSLSVVQVTILSKNLDFRKQAIINFISAAVSGIIGVVLAYKGFAVWALVFQTMTSAVFQTVFFWTFSTWRPSFSFSWQSFRSLYHFGYKIFLQGFSDVIFTKIYYPIIGKLFSVTDLGYYANANRFYELVVKKTTIAYGRVTFPAFSAIQDDKERFVHNYLQVYSLLAFVMFPCVLMAILGAKPFVAFFLTAKWLPAVPLMILFFTEGFFFSFFMLNQNTFNAIGRSDISLTIDIIKKTFIFISLFIGIKFGIMGLIAGQILSSFVVYLFSTIIVMRRFKIKVFQQFLEILPIIIITISCFFFYKLIIERFINNNLILIGSQLVSIPIIYLVLAHLFRIKPYSNFIKLFKDFIPAKLKTFLDI
jgi:O-antigen/teichoic acid export membrane protein